MPLPISSNCRLPSSAVIDELIAIGARVPVTDWTFADWPDHEGGLPFPLRGALTDLLSQVRRDMDSDGFSVVGWAHLLDSAAEATCAAAVTSFLSFLGAPLRVFLRQPHWRPLGVDLSRPPNRSGGVGFNPLHMDFVNAENPPDVVCLLCMRPDPLGGGVSLVARMCGVERALGPRDLAVLSARRFTDGVVENLNGVGGDSNPFPVLALGSPWAYRYTANLLNSAGDPDTLTALRAVADFLVSRLVRIPLRRGDLLILDQHQVAHGREALGEPQGKFPSEERRYLLHSFLRKAVRGQVGATTQ